MENEQKTMEQQFKVFRKFSEIEMKIKMIQYIDQISNNNNSLNLYTVLSSQNKQMESVQKQFITFFLRKSQSISNEFLSLQFSIPWKYKRIVKYILNIYNSFNQTMQCKIDLTTGGLKFYEADPPKKQHKQQFKSSDDINADFDPKPSILPLQKRIELIKSVGAQIVNEELLKDRLLSKQFLKCYDGFEPSGRMHIAQGLLRAINVNKMVDAGCIFIFWVADYFAMLNGKFDGDLQKIRTVGRYFIEVWKAVGMKTENVKFIWASEQINARSNQYWLQVMDIACKNSIGRIQKCATIMGKKQSDQLKVSQLFYPCMQCTDVFFLDVDICQLGIDQRKVNMLAVEYAPQNNKPIVVSHGMISGLIEGQQKMSKSNPDSAIFMQDSAKDVQKKIKKAFCPEKIVENNPILDYCKNILFKCRDSITVTREKEHGGDIVFNSYEALQKSFVEGDLHPNDLKPTVAKIINELIEPVRKHFQTDPKAKALLNTIKSFKKSEPTVQIEEKTEKKQ